MKLQQPATSKRRQSTCLQWQSTTSLKTHFIVLMHFCFVRSLRRARVVMPTTRIKVRTSDPRCVL